MSDRVTDFLSRQGINSKELKHYGVVGMKWGIRRDRLNRAAGAKASSTGRKARGEESARTKVKRSSGAKPKNTFSNKPDNRRMSDAELRNKLNRLNMEKQYKELTATPKSKSFVKELLAEQGKSAVRQITTRAVSVGVQMALEKAAGSASGGNKDFLEAMAKSGQSKKKKN